MVHGAWCRCWVGLLALLWVPVGQAQPRPLHDEAAVKAAIIVNLLAFVEWPVDAALPAGRLVVCTAGQGAVVDGLRSAQGRGLDGRRLELRELSRDAPRGSCHVLYLASNTDDVLTRIVPELRGSGLLVITDTADWGGKSAMGQGAMVQLALAGSRVVFDVDLRFARLAGLTFSSKVLQLARTVWQ